MTYEAEETIWNIKDWRLIYKLELLPNCRRWQSWWYYTTQWDEKKTLKWAASETWWSFGEGMKTKEQRHWNKKICGWLWLYERRRKERLQKRHQLLKKVRGRRKLVANWTQISQELWKEHFIDSRPLSTTDTLKQLRICWKI